MWIHPTSGGNRSSQRHTEIFCKMESVLWKSFLLLFLFFQVEFVNAFLSLVCTLKCSSVITDELSCLLLKACKAWAVGSLRRNAGLLKWCQPWFVTNGLSLKIITVSLKQDVKKRFTVQKREDVRDTCEQIVRKERKKPWKSHLIWTFVLHDRGLLVSYQSHNWMFLKHTWHSQLLFSHSLFWCLRWRDCGVAQSCSPCPLNSSYTVCQKATKTSWFGDAVKSVSSQSFSNVSGDHAVQCTDTE